MKVTVYHVGNITAKYEDIYHIAAGQGCLNLSEMDGKLTSIPMTSVISYEVQQQ